MNEEKFLPRLIDSIKKQSFADYEIIVSDGGSLDNTKKIALENGCKFVIDVEHHSPSWQRNNGAAVAKGDILLFLDADSVLQKDFLVNAFREFENRKLTVASFYIKFNPNHWYYNIYSSFSNFICFLKQISVFPAAMGAALMSKNEAHVKIKGFDPEVLLSEDCDYCSRLSKVGKFRMLQSTRLLYSSRRIEKEGYFKTGWRWFKMGFFTIFNKRIKKQIVKYDFGKF